MTDYTVGYRRPPASGRFKKGASGNPRGRPKGSRNFLTLLEQELAQTVVVNEDGKRKNVTRLQAMVKRLVAGALQGDQKSLLTLVEILRRAGQFDAPEVESLAPDNYRSILDAYVDSQQKASSRKTSTKEGRS